tara:strand:+ start:668 stop:997 length:330 start_codon:yes stop_codon:yes gene_type:complete
MIKAYAEYNWEKTIGKKVLSNTSAFLSGWNATLDPHATGPITRITGKSVFYQYYSAEKSIPKSKISYVEVTKEDAENVANAYRIRHETDMETRRNFEAAVKMCVEGEVL